MCKLSHPPATSASEWTESPPRQPDLLPRVPESASASEAALTVCGELEQLISQLYHQHVSGTLRAGHWWAYLADLRSRCPVPPDLRDWLAELDTYLERKD